MYFEWTIAENNNIVVQVSESSDEEMDEEGELGAGAPQGDVEGAAVAAAARIKPRDPNKPLVDEVIPVYRRDCHEEVKIFSLKVSMDFFTLEKVFFKIEKKML